MEDQHSLDNSKGMGHLIPMVELAKKENFRSPQPSKAETAVRCLQMDWTCLQQFYSSRLNCMLKI